jgi:hypothetical protein
VCTATGAKLEHGVQGHEIGSTVCSRLSDPFDAVGRGSALLLPGGLRDLACRQRRVTASQMAGMGRARLWVPETLQTSCDLLIFVEEAADAVVSLDLGDLGRRPVGSGREGAACPRLRCGR